MGLSINNQKSTIFNPFAPCVRASVVKTWRYSKAPPRTVTCFVGCDPIEGRFHGPGSRRFSLSIGKFCRLLEYLHKHFPRQFSRLRVLI
jgi:hypothetical protein